MESSGTDAAGNQWTSGEGTGTLIAVEIRDERALLVIRTAGGFRHLRTTRIDQGSRDIVEKSSRTLVGHRVGFETIQFHGAVYTPPEIRALNDLGTDYDYDAAKPEYQAPAAEEPEAEAPPEVVGELMSVEHDEPSSRFLVHIATDTGVQRLWTGTTDGPGSDGVRGTAMALKFLVGKRVSISVAGQPPAIESFGLDR